VIVVDYDVLVAEAMHYYYSLSSFQDQLHDHDQLYNIQLEVVAPMLHIHDVGWCWADEENALVSILWVLVENYNHMPFDIVVLHHENCETTVMISIQ